MKLTMLCLLLSFAQLLASKGFSQSTARLTLNLEDVRVEEVLLKIEEQCNLYFIYNREVVDVNRKVDVSYNNQEVTKVLSSLFSETGVEYEIRDSHIILKSRTGQAGQKQVSGSVTDSNGQPLPGVTVVVKGTTQGTITDVDGNYTLSDVPGDGTLVFSFVGMKAQEIPVTGKTSINVVMAEDAIGIEEVVAIGYGTIKKRDLTGAVASVNQERFADIPATNLTAALQGSVAGVSISTPYGTPGGSSSILIRGLNSINASNDPLVVIDGIPGGFIDDITPGDIKSVEVLKDAASTAIYGSRATSGVIIITTKSGIKGKSSVSYEGYYGLAQIAKGFDFLSVDEYIGKKRETYRMLNYLTFAQAQELSVETILATGYELDMYNMGKSYDWQEELFQTAPMQSHSLSMNGGTEKTQYFLSANWVDQNGIAETSGFERQSVRANVSSSVTDWFNIGINLFATKSSQDRLQEGQDGFFENIFKLSPLAQKYTDENSQEQYALYPMYPDPFVANPFTEMAIKDRRDRTRLMNSTFAEISFLKNFSYKITVNTTLDFINNKEFIPFYTKIVEAKNKFESASIRRDHNSLLNIENMLSYNRTFGDHQVGALAVFTTEKYKGEGLYAYAKDFGTDYYEWKALQLGNVDFRNISSSEENTFLESLIGRVNYSFKGKYLAQFTVRRDRSSKFAPENREAIFPGGSFGWRISDEAFMKNARFVDNLKLRLSYAHTGNQGIGYRSIYNVGSKVYYTTGQDAAGQIVEGLVQSTLANKDLRWEKSAQANLGLDFSIFKGKLSGVLEAYQTKTSDLLLNRDISSLTGFTSILTNIGSVENRGIEVALNSNVIERNSFYWNIGATFTTNKNKITELYGDGMDDYTNRWFIGQPIGVIYDYVFDGVLQEGETAPEYMDNIVGTVGDGKNIVPGETKVKDIGGWETLEDGTVFRTKVPDGKIDEADMTVIGQTQPKWLASIGMQFKYKNLDASFMINHVNGTLRQIPGSVFGREPFSLDIPYYTDENQNTRYGRPAWPATIDGIKRGGNSYGRLSMYQSGTYTRLQDITLGYTLSKHLPGRIGINSVRFYVTGQNLITITDYIGYDPSLEYTSNQTDANFNRVDGYPTVRTWLFGLKVNF